MTEKRFTHKKWYDERQLFDGEEAFAIVDSGTQASIICNKLNKLHEENDRLKKELNDYHNTFDCSQCKYQNYDWFDDGDEFEVCDKGNTEAQMYNHSCIDWGEL